MTREEELKKLAIEWEEYKNSRRRHEPLPVSEETSYYFTEIYFQTPFDVVVDLLGTPNVKASNLEELESVFGPHKESMENKEIVKLSYHFKLLGPEKIKFEILSFHDEGYPSPEDELDWLIMVENSEHTDTVVEYVDYLFDARAYNKPFRLFGFN